MQMQKKIGKVVIVVHLYNKIDKYSHFSLDTDRNIFFKRNDSHGCCTLAHPSIRYLLLYEGKMK